MMAGESAPSCSARLARTAGRSCELLDRGSAGSIARFVLSRLDGDGGFRGRSQTSDLYYTLFGLDCLRALERPLPVDQTAGYLKRFGDGAGLDLVHLSCLARCLVLVGDRPGAASVLQRIDEERGPDGGYRLSPDDGEPSAYASFLALLAHHECGGQVPDPAALRRSVAGLGRDDGAFVERSSNGPGTTTVTAAAVLMLLALGHSLTPSAGQWLLDRLGPHGGFGASPEALVPDLLSTAAALVALDALGVSLNGCREASLGFIEALWEPDGGFAGHPFESTSDCEYTYYALLGLGVLAGAR